MRKIFLFLILINVSFNLLAQDYYDYGNETMKINNYVVKTYGHSKELSDDITPYQETLGVEGLSFKQILPDDPQTDDIQNWIRIGNYASPNFSKITINEGEWVSGFSISDSRFQISIGDRIFTIGDAKEETLAKLDLGYKFYKNKQNVIQVFYQEASLTIGFKDDQIRYFNFDNLFY